MGEGQKHLETLRYVNSYKSLLSQYNLYYRKHMEMTV